MVLPHPIRVVLAADDPTIHVAVRTLLETDPALMLVGEALNATGIIRVCETVRPDITLLYVPMPGAYVRLAIRALHTHVPDTPILILSDVADYGELCTIARFPISGYLLTAEIEAHLLDAIRTSVTGIRWGSLSLRHAC